MLNVSMDPKQHFSYVSKIHCLMDEIILSVLYLEGKNLLGKAQEINKT